MAARKQQKGNCDIKILINLISISLKFSLNNTFLITLNLSQANNYIKDQQGGYSRTPLDRYS